MNKKAVAAVKSTKYAYVNNSASLENAEVLCVVPTGRSCVVPIDLLCLNDRTTIKIILLLFLLPTTIRSLFDKDFRLLHHVLVNRLVKVSERLITAESVRQKETWCSNKNCDNKVMNH